jgi:hypothetical protein
MPSSDDYQGQGGGFGTLEEDEYRVRIESYKAVDNTPSQYNPEGKGQTLYFYLRPLAYAESDREGEELTDIEGQPLNPEKFVVFFADPQRMGMRPQIAKTRKFVAAALQVGVEEGLDFEWDDLIGKEVIAYIGQKGDKNKVLDIRPLKRRPRRAVATAPLIDKAKEIFDAEDAPAKDSHDDLPF